MNREFGVRKIKLEKAERFFQGLPVREARGDLLVQPTRGDIAIAKPHDPENCAYAVCIKRMLQTKRVYVYTTVCYVEALDEDGNSVLERYIVKDRAHAYIQRFDKGEPVGPGGFILHKPTGSKTLDYKRRASRIWYGANLGIVRERAKEAYIKQRDKKRATAAATAAATTKKKNWRVPALKHALTGTFRDGKGQVRFIGTGEGRLTIHRETNGVA